jgi:hypothetical protein
MNNKIVEAIVYFIGGCAGISVAYLTFIILALILK